MQPERITRGAARSLAAVCVALAALAACGRDAGTDAEQSRAAIAQAEADAVKDVADARVAAQDDIADAQRDAAGTIRDVGPGTPEAAQARLDVRQTAADSAYDVAIAQAEGAHKVALERCDTMAGDARRACRDRADAELELARARARQAREGGA